MLIIPLDYDNTTAHQILVKTLYNYARENLALVNIYIKEPVVTKILRDQRIPIIWFVANCGGILGLCMGFSIVTVFEVLHCLAKSSFASINSWYSRIKRHKQPDQPLMVSTTTSAASALSNGDTMGGNNGTIGKDCNEVVIRMETVPNGRHISPSKEINQV